MHVAQPYSSHYIAHLLAHKRQIRKTPNRKNATAIKNEELIDLFALDSTSNQKFIPKSTFFAALSNGPWEPMG